MGKKKLQKLNLFRYFKLCVLEKQKDGSRNFGQGGRNYFLKS